MRKLWIAAVCAAQLAGCAALKTEFDNVFGAGSSANVVAQLQAATTAACSFVPTAASAGAVITQYLNVAGIANIADAGMLINQIATDICAAVLPPKAGGKRATSAPVLRGVVIHGKFLH